MSKQIPTGILDVYSTTDTGAPGNFAKEIARSTWGTRRNRNFIIITLLKVFCMHPCKIKLSRQ